MCLTLNRHNQSLSQCTCSRLYNLSGQVRGHTPSTAGTVRKRFRKKNGRPWNRTQSVSWNTPRKYGWEAPSPTIQSKGVQSVSRILSPQYVRGRTAVQKWFRRGPLRAYPGTPSSTGGMSETHACKKEREKRERERRAREGERRRRRRRRRRSRSRPGQTDKTKKDKKHVMVQHGPASSRPSPASTKPRMQRREPEPAPRGRRGKKKEKEERRRKTEPETGPPKNARTRKRRQDSLYPVQNPIQITPSAPNKTTSTTNHGVRCAKLSGKTRRNKNRTPKKQASEKENSLSPFSGRKTGVFRPKKPPRKNPGLPFRVRDEKPSEQKPKTDRTLKSRKSKREGLQKRVLEKNGQHVPPNP